MKTDDRLFAPFPIEMDEHPKIIGLSDAAFRALIEATFYSRRMLSDGFLDERVVLLKWGQTVADELSSNDPERPSWVRVDRGWRIHDFEKHHPLKADIEALKSARSLAGRAGGKQSASNREAKRKQSPSKSNPETETETETYKDQKTSLPAATETDFETAYSHWPKKAERKKSFEKFITTARKRGVEQLTADVILFGDAYAATTERRFVPALNVWLNGERWTDDLPQARTPQHRLTAAERALELSEQIRRGENASITNQRAIG